VVLNGVAPTGGSGSSMNWAPTSKATRKMQDQQNFLERCVNSGIAICSTVYALTAGYMVHNPSYKWAVLLVYLGELVGHRGPPSDC